MFSLVFGGEHAGLGHTLKWLRLVLGGEAFKVPWHLLAYNAVHWRGEEESCSQGVGESPIWSIGCRECHKGSQHVSG